MTGMEVCLPLTVVVPLDQAFHKAQVLGFMLVAYPMLCQRPWSESTLLIGARWVSVGSSVLC